MNKKGKIIGLALIAIMVVSLFTAVMSVAGNNGNYKPDLEIEDKWEVWDAGDKTYQVHYKINNTGNATAPKCHYTALYVDGVVKELHFVPDDLVNGDPAKQYKFPTPLECENGTHNITVCADYYDVIGEWNETNNCKSNNLTCMPDLVVEKEIVWKDCNKSYTVEYTVKNIGNATAPCCHYTALYLDGIAKEWHLVSVALEPDALITGEFAPINCTASDQDHNVTVCTDDFNSIAEWDETNNCEINKFICQPDLVVEKEIKWTDCDKEFYVEFTIKNKGNATALKGHDAALYVDGAREEEVRVPVDLKPCESYDSRFDFQTECTNGTHNITVCADDNNEVNELDETNNCEINEFTCMPDLVIEDKHEEWVNRTHYKVKYTVKNQGNATAQAGHSTSLYVDGTCVDPCDTVPLALKPCESYPGEFKAIKCTVGIHNITVCADDCCGTHFVTEWNETNNCEENELKCGADLEITDKKEVWVNETHYKVNYTIHNDGTTIALKGHTTALYVNGIEIERKLVEVDLAPCNTKTYTFDTAIDCTPPGDNITVCADICDFIEEVDETNNCEENYLKCGPDLEITDKKEAWVNGTHYNVTYTIHNNGTETAPAGHKTTLKVDGVDVEHKEVPVALKPGTTHTDTFNTAIKCTPLRDTIEVCADNDKEVVELDEGNNCLTNDLTCGPDLVISAKHEEWVQAAGNYKVTYTIKNIGITTAPAGHDTTLKVDGVDVDHKEVPVALAPGATHTDTFNAVIMITPPKDIIEVCADNFNEVPELDETNNCLDNEWAYDEKPDLVIVAKWEKERRGTYTVYFEIKNIGTAPTPRRVRHYAELSVNGVVIAKKGIRTTLDPGETYKSHFRTRIPCPGPAIDNIKVCADKYNVINELNENNNCLVNDYTCP